MRSATYASAYKAAQLGAGVKLIHHQTAYELTRLVINRRRRAIVMPLPYSGFAFRRRLARFPRLLNLRMVPIGRTDK